ALPSRGATTATGYDKLLLHACLCDGKAAAAPSLTCEAHAKEPDGPIERRCGMIDRDLSVRRLSSMLTICRPYRD
ncbi:MAG: hypothetical protein ABL921_31970, partial [Pirellula sp.]